MRKTRPVLVLILFLTFAGMVRAQETVNLEIGGYASQTQWKARQFQINAPQAIPPIDIGFRYEDKPVYGIRFNFLSSGFWGGEIDYNFQRNTVRLSRESFTPVALDGNVQHLYYNTIFYPLRYRQRVNPFLTAGIGLAAYKLSSEARARAADPKIYRIGELKDLDKRVAFNYGGGIKVLIAGPVGLRADFRHNFSDVPSYGLPKESANPNQHVLPIQGKLQNYEFSAGIYLHALK